MRKRKVGPRVFGLVIVSSLLGLSACQSTTGCYAEDTGCFNNTKKIFKTKTPPPTLNPQFNYIKLIMNGNTLWLAQGATAQWPSTNTQVFYSADRSVFKFSNGRLISVTTPLINWREHIDQPVNWPLAKPFQFERTLDTVDGMTAMPEQREVDEVDVPSNHSYVGDANNVVWMHEYTVAQSQVAQSYPAFDSWYAFDFQNMNEPVYGQQCISKQYCLSWQVWKTQ